MKGTFSATTRWLARSRMGISGVDIPPDPEWLDHRYDDPLLPLNNPRPALQDPTPIHEYLRLLVSQYSLSRLIVSLKSSVDDTLGRVEDDCPGLQGFFVFHPGILRVPCIRWRNWLAFGTFFLIVQLRIWQEIQTRIQCIPHAMDSKLRCWAIQFHIYESYHPR